MACKYIARTSTLRQGNNLGASGGDHLVRSLRTHPEHAVHRHGPTADSASRSYDRETQLTCRRVHGDPRRDYAGEWRAWRKAKGWTQKELAAVLGVSLRTVTNTEKGHHPPSISSREKMAKLQRRHREAEV